MGKFFDRFKGVGNKIDKQVNKINQDIKSQPQSFRGGRIREKRPEKMGEGIYEDFDEGFDEDFNDNLNRDDDVWVQPAQKPESFHHFILENQYKDLERSIRGFKDVFNKDTQQWKTIRKKEHCFTDEEAEEILRTAQSHLATDIKLSLINKEVFGEMMTAIYKRIDELFYSIGEYRYGRYSHNEDGSEIPNGEAIEYKMKLQNRKIFLELWTRIQANYSRAIQGQENRFTHDSVKGQESLQQSGQDGYQMNRGFS